MNLVAHRRCRLKAGRACQFQVMAGTQEEREKREVRVARLAVNFRGRRDKPRRGNDQRTNPRVRKKPHMRKEYDFTDSVRNP